ncbi:MAG: hypothetical protein COW24_01885 [Candidatus Kerfeldbacteria bacterium CG15_BIG_FIL_POST_REV_8_21_14_020_45_12]|uniref:Bacterial type II secretion system protein E domain-containing protein n=1 Tax=Candidatus Kerfeldbacteria bacterium CG15_BIG_FIL_POST_REV_8_21_14_020_45_12 TaxID=2014247 RepID=A0A2M7H4E7_9BACT|nr:MAG: hypothetical protein COW24_01885 [Candidatus Kerfeldbacteria bacterium CG15_BIG_FIL_POST_REV_8_21_14_020_45_12]PJA93201.1 MAG: hypothetical protein CO132_04435 [Candidatus Kerfeldbacteria bacterium CG_4_9_14_3_um_filter_45_8]
MQLSDDKLKEILVSEDYVSQDDIKAAEKYAHEHGTNFLDYLFSSDALTADLLGQAVAEHLKVPYADLNSHIPPKEQVLLIPEATARQLRVVVFDQPKTGSILITSDNPTDINIKTDLQPLFADKKIELRYSLPEDIDDVFANYRKTLSTRFSKIIQEQQRVAPEIIDEIVADALLFNASDIHFEPQVDEVVIRFRVDGVLQEAGRLPKRYYDSMLNRIKVQARLRIDEHYAAQDGAIRFESASGDYVDMRVSVAPIIEGEKVVIRLLSQYVRNFTFNDLGLRQEDQDTLIKAMKKPHGMILVTGPTGSGKTTTLYSMIKILNRPEVNITTIEDPVEYKVDGINQIQVNEHTNLTFADGLRSVVRQDPDVILVGEIRDHETAEIAVNAALTGHLLLSTFHANDAATAVPRLLDMGIEPFLLASTLETILAQRLVRKICENCRISFPIDLVEISELIPGAKKFFPAKTTLYRGKGCDSCHHTGFNGRSAIYEFIDMTPEMQALILQHPSTQEIWKLARSQGSQTLFEDGVSKVRAGVTTITELARVAEPPE